MKKPASPPNQSRDQLRDQLRDDALLSAAYRCFLGNGFTKTSMSDIAQAAGVSRPTLYASYANKTEIFLAVSAELHNRTIDECQRTAAIDGTLTERLENAVEAKLRAHMDVASTSIHGQELLDLNQRIAGDLVADAEKRFLELITSLFVHADGTEVDLNAHGLSASRAARLVVAYVDGIKYSLLATAGQPPRTWRSDLKTTIGVLVRGLQA